MVDLAKLYGSIKYEPGSPKVSERLWRIDSSTLPAPPDELCTDKLAISIGEKFSDWISYGNRNDVVQLFGTRETFRHLGYLLFAKLFAGQSRAINLELTHQSSVIRRLVIDGIDSEPDGSTEGLELKPYCFHYEFKPAEEYPFEAGNADRLYCINSAYDLPRFIVESEARMPQGPEYWASRNRVRFCPNFVGMALFAQLLLDISFSREPIDEFHLYTHPMFQAVAPGSAEVSIWLPGSFAWNDDSLL